MKDTSIIKIESAARNFKSLLSEGLQKINEACILYVELIDNMPHARRQFQDACPEVPAEAWYAFELVGRSAMDYRLLWGGGRAQLKMRRLPRSVQTALLDDGVEVADVNGDKRIVPADMLTKDDIKQVFCGNRIRSVTEQIIWLKRNAKIQGEAAPDEADYYISNGKLVVLRAMKIPVTTLRKMVRK